MHTKNTIFSAKDNWKDYLAYLKKVFPSLSTSVRRIPANTWCNAVGSMDCSSLWGRGEWRHGGFCSWQVPLTGNWLFIGAMEKWNEWINPGKQHQLSCSPAQGSLGTEWGISSHRYELMWTLCSDIPLQTFTVCSLLLLCVYLDPSSTKRWVPFADAASVFALGGDSSWGFVFSTCSCC